MLAIVPRELVTARKLPRAALPVAVIRLFARMGSHVRFQVRTLRVGLRAAHLQALVHARLMWFVEKGELRVCFGLALFFYFGVLDWARVVVPARCYAMAVDEAVRRIGQRRRRRNG